MKSKMSLHLQENNAESLSNLESNEQKFSDQCLMIVNLLNQGVRLTVKKAIDEYGIASLPRRIMDCRKRNGITNIQDEWIKDEKTGKRLYKEWFIERPTRPTKIEVIKNWEEKTLPQEGVQEVTLRDGTILRMGDEVTTEVYKQCIGETFVICEMNPWPGGCESGVLVVAHLKGDPSRKLKGLKVEGMNHPWPDGLDANCFKLKK